MDPKTLLSFVPTYDGDAFNLYNFINCAKHWLQIAGGDTPPNVMLLLSKLESKAAMTISMVDHDFKWKNIELTLKKECGDNREFNTLLIELSNVKRKGSYKDLIFELKQKLFFIRSKLLDKYSEKTLVDEVMEPYINTAQNALRNSLPYHDQIYVSNCGFEETAARILQLEAEGRFDNIKQKFSSILPPPRIVQQGYSQHKPNFVNQKHSYPNYPQNPRINYNNNNYNHNHNQSNNNFHQKYPWKPNPNNVFNKPQNSYFKRNQYRPVNRNINETEDVSMRTAPQLRPGQTNLGKGLVAEEVFHTNNIDEANFYKKASQKKGP
ncbi:unnamed protein product [Colias eurytheme]|nr:unnamed protein product [Colias eurytheme]